MPIIFKEITVFLVQQPSFTEVLDYSLIFWDFLQGNSSIRVSKFKKAVEVVYFSGKIHGSCHVVDLKSFLIAAAIAHC